ELLARADVPQAARLARELGRARRELEAPFERLLLGLERVHLRSPCVQRVVRRDPAPQRPVIEQRDEQDRAHREPAAEQKRTGWTSAGHRGGSFAPTPSTSFYAMSTLIRFVVPAAKPPVREADQWRGCG